MLSNFSVFKCMYRIGRFELCAGIGEIRMESAGISRVRAYVWVTLNRMECERQLLLLRVGLK